MGTAGLWASIFLRPQHRNGSNDRIGVVVVGSIEQADQTLAWRQLTVQSPWLDISASGISFTLEDVDDDDDDPEEVFCLITYDHLDGRITIAPNPPSAPDTATTAIYISIEHGAPTLLRKFVVPPLRKHTPCRIRVVVNGDEKRAPTTTNDNQRRQTATDDDK